MKTVTSESRPIPSHRFYGVLYQRGAESSKTNINIEMRHQDWGVREMES